MKTIALTTICLALVWSCHAQEGRLDSLSAQTELPPSRAFVWSDSAIAARGPFATPPWSAPFRPDTIDNILYWHGGVFVLPGTPDSVLTAHGFRDVIRKPGSVMHDYFEARWPVYLELDSLPLAIRQIRYGDQPFSYSLDPPWNRYECVILGHRYYRVHLLMVPNLPDAFFQAYGIRRDSLPHQKLGWAIEYVCEWPEELSVQSSPREFYRMELPPCRFSMRDIETTIYMGEEFYALNVYTNPGVTADQLSALGFRWVGFGHQFDDFTSWNASWPKSADPCGLPEFIRGFHPHPPRNLSQAEAWNLS